MELHFGPILTKTSTNPAGYTITVSLVRPNSATLDGLCQERRPSNQQFPLCGEKKCLSVPFNEFEKGEDGTGRELAIFALKNKMSLDIGAQ